MAKAILEDLNLRGRRCLIRVDFNVPLDDQGAITDDTRIRAALPTIRYVLDAGAGVVLMSHLGRPKGKVVPGMSLKPVADRLAELLETPVLFATDTVGDSARTMAAALEPGQVLLLENLRFAAKETDNDPGFAAALAALGDVYVNDAFGTAHRAHASTAGICSHFDETCAGLLMGREIRNLERLRADVPRPFVAILGGAKIKGKVEIIENLLGRVDTLLLGGGMIFTFFKHQGLSIGNSILDEESLDVAGRILEKAATVSTELVLPTDCVVADAFSGEAERREVGIDGIPDDWMGVDIGPATCSRYAGIIKSSRAVFWNGPMGVFEIPAFAAGTRAVGEAVADATTNGAHSVVGGGDSVAAINQLGLADRISHISTGGGASLEFMAGRDLPGIVALG